MIMTNIEVVTEFLDDLRGGRMIQAPVVTVEEGQVQGKLVKTPGGKSYYSFQGIPYAKPPLGSLRFKAPQSPEPWDGIRDATTEGNVSAQIDRLTDKQYYVGDENCLFLNVYTPTIDGEFLPVMLYVHGGGYLFGSGSSTMYGPDYLVEKDVIVVTVNYRCGALGFLSLNTPEVPGNAGLKDVIQAVRWVKENIKNFGGNSGNLTVFGESAGGAVVSMLAVSPLTKDLISKVIIQSGTALNNWAFQKYPINNARALANELGCESNDIDDILEFLTTTPVKDIVEANNRLAPVDLFIDSATSLFAPVVEKEFPGVEAALTEPFIDLITSGRIANVPIMIGTTTLEFTHERTEDLQSFIPSELNIVLNSDESLAIAEKIKRLYFKGDPNSVESLNEKFQLLSDVLVNIDTYRLIQYLVRATNKPIYYYKFDYVGELNLTNKLLKSLGLKHAGHMDELGYLFKCELQKDVEPTPDDVKMRERMLRLWTNFAKSGNPTPEENHYVNITWQPVTKDNLYYLNISNELSLGTCPDKEKMEFWDDLYVKHFKIWDHPKSTEASPVKEVVDTTPVKEVVDTTPVKEVVDTTPVIVKETVIESVTVVNDDKADDEIVVETVTETFSETERSEVRETIIITQDIVDHVENKSHKIENHIESNLIEEVKPAQEDFKEIVEEIRPVKEVALANEDLSDKIRPVHETITIFTESIHSNGVEEHRSNGVDKKPRPSNEIKMVQNNNINPTDVIRANDPPEDDLPKNIGVNKFVNFFESLGKK
ncbi:juvenile hormone esterase-like isoform X3 [Leptidea sinapis]|uniref:juvenile hormone esterase-like isoform X3 n=1 Tax=Leptidea sinapis TaxID=189913 RepID=UPI0021C3C29A|nr:juvenile hormone esterase-like isoform X3 [Leptidea sinapis]